MTFLNPHNYPCPACDGYGLLSERSESDVRPNPSPGCERCAGTGVDRDAEEHFRRLGTDGDPLR